MREVAPLFVPALDPGFVPAVLWSRAYAAAAAAAPDSRQVRFSVARPDGSAWSHATRLLPPGVAYDERNWRYAERLVKFLLWAWGGSSVTVEGAPEIAARLRRCYAQRGERSFDATFMGETCFLQPFDVREGGIASAAAPVSAPSTLGRHLDGCRIGFDLGGSDRKCAAVVDGEVVFSEEVKWSPYFEKDPAYHVAGIRDTLRRAAAHLPRVDAIGGSAAGIYIGNEPRVASLFRGISRDDFARAIRPLFHELRREWGGVPFEVANDGDVTALAGAMAIGDNAVLGISMGTSLAAGYIDPQGHLTGWINELAFVPVDYRDGGPVDEWSGDAGCGVQYFSQQAVGRLLPASGIVLPDELPLPEKLEQVQARMAAGDERAAAIYATIGTCFGYAVAQFADFYDFRHLLVLGRVVSGAGGEVILREARRVLDGDFADVSAKIAFHQPDEKTKRHGQAVAAASLPRIS